MAILGSELRPAAAWPACAAPPLLCWAVGCGCQPAAAQLQTGVWFKKKVQCLSNFQTEK